MAAEFDFELRGKPAKIISGNIRNKKGGFGKVILGRHRLHQIVVDPGIERTNCRRVAAEYAVGESINLK